jgi:hypothetical protein
VHLIITIQITPLIWYDIFNCNLVDTQWQ